MGMEIVPDCDHFVGEAFNTLDGGHGCFRSFVILACGGRDCIGTIAWFRAFCMAHLRPRLRDGQVNGLSRASWLLPVWRRAWRREPRPLESDSRGLNRTLAIPFIGA
jgi:hypothetical protein